MAQGQEQLTRYQLVAFALIMVTTLPFAAAIVRGVVKTIIYTNPVYTVSINSVSGLDGDLAAPVSPSFNLTFRIDERAGRRTACVGHRAAVAVDYRGALLGRGPAPEFCVDAATGAAEAPAAAWAADVKLPEFMRGQLADELRLGTAAFGVSVLVPSERTGEANLLFECRGKVGEESPPCTTTYVAARDRDENLYYLFP
ncbi:hypothetical protein ACP70R_025069 [Stipagrostis hirtigluma subsp. patula]